MGLYPCQHSRITYGNAINPTPGVSYTWDVDYPRVNAMTDGTGTTIYTYKQPGVAGALQLASEDGPGKNDIIQISYDMVGRLQSWYVYGGMETYAFDALGRVVSNKNTSLGTFKYSYLGDTGQLTQVILNGKPIERTFAYEDNTGDRRLKDIANPENARSFGYTNAPENLITSLTETVSGQSRTWNYAYDAIDRLQSADRSDGAQYDYVLDKGDNITGIIDPSGSRMWTHDAGNKIAQAPYKYDANGNRTEDDKHTYKWDAENRLIWIGYKTDPQKSTEFKYDGQGRRVAIIEKAGSTEKETRYTWCGDRICQARDGNDQPIAYYFGEGTFRPEPNTPVSKFQGEREYYAKDHLGSVRDVLDQQGNVTASYDYDPYGKLTNSPVKQPEFGYAGMQYHAPSGLYLMKYRIYEPGTGKWLSRDPIGEAGGINLYGYVKGNPVSLVDFLGLLGMSPEECKQILEEIEREYRFIDILQQVRRDIMASESGNMPVLSNYGMGPDATPYGYRGSMYNNSSPTYKNAVDAMEGNTWFTIGGRAGSFIAGTVGLIATTAKINDSWSVRLNKHHNSTMIATEIYRQHYVITQMKKVYKENCEECEK